MKNFGMAGRNNTQADALCHVVWVNKIVAAPLPGSLGRGGCRGVLFRHTQGDRVPCTATERRGYSAAAMLTERSAQEFALSHSVFLV